ncbi:MAG: hypothetical protein JXA77_01540 [Bacteroidales bacterium]|nr:hypothetical protein [Bacteroidales bacterium]MBN2820125.1 hypothetical protein [Bacteroidales bacterium]
MKKYITIILFFSLPFIAFSQQDKKPDMDDLKAKMVLRENTRDKVAVVNDHHNKLKYQKRSQMMSVQQRKLMQQRMQQIQRQQIQRKHIMQQRKKVREDAARRRQMRGR